MKSAAILLFVLSLSFVFQSKAEYILEPTNFVAQTFEPSSWIKIVNISERPKGLYLLKISNGNTGPFKAADCNLLNSESAIRKCLAENVVEPVSTDFTRFENVSLAVNGRKVAGTLVGRQFSYREILINLDQDVNQLTFSYMGAPSTSRCTYSIESIESANHMPKAFFTVNKLTSVAPFNIVVNARESFDLNNDSLEYSWNFGDGRGVKTGKQATYSYNQAGIYQVTLSVLNKTGLSSQFTVPVEVLGNHGSQNRNQVPILKVNASVNSLNPRRVNIDPSGSIDPDGTIQRFEYTFGDGSKVNSDFAAEHSYSHPGTYLLTVRAVDNQNGIGEKEKSINVDVNPALAPVGTVWGPVTYHGAGSEQKMYSSQFAVQDSGPDKLYRIRVENADGLVHPTNASCEGFINYLVCQYTNWVNTKYIDENRVDWAHIYVNNVRISASGDLNKARSVFEGYVVLKSSNKINIQLQGSSTAFLKVTVDELGIRQLNELVVDGQVSIAEGSTGSFNVKLSSSPVSPVTVSIGTDGLTTASPSTLVFDSTNWNTIQRIDVAAIDDMVDRGSVYTSTTTMNLSSSDSVYNGKAYSFVSSITDNDTAGLDVVETGGATTVAEGGQTDTLQVRLRTQPLSPVVVSFDAGTQIQPISSITFDASNWNVYQTIQIAAVDDAIVEGPHFQNLIVQALGGNYSNSSNVVVAASIIDNDPLEGDVTYTFATVTSSRTLTGSENWINIDASSSSVTVTLPNPSTNAGKKFVFKRIDDNYGRNALIWGYGSEQVGDPSALSAVTLHTQGETYTLVSDGSNWKTINHRIPSIWTSYTPTFTNFNTPTNVEFQWKRVGTDLHIRGKFTTGVSGGSAAEARISLPNGWIIRANEADGIPSIQFAGTGAHSTADTSKFNVLMESSKTYITFGWNDGVSSGLSKCNGSSFNSGDTISFTAVVPIENWKFN